MSVVTKACKGLLCGAALLVLPAAGIAQNTVTTDNVVANDVAADPYNTVAPTYDNTVTTVDTDDDDDKDFPWGLLGLLGLAGLLGLKRRDDARDINVDARRDKRP